MSTQHFCDSCGERITKENEPKGDGTLRGGMPAHDRIHGVTKGGLAYEVIVGHREKPDGSVSWNGGAFCAPCIIDAVKSHGPQSKKLLPETAARLLTDLLIAEIETLIAEYRAGRRPILPPMSDRALRSLMADVKKLPKSKKGVSRK